MTEAAIFIAEAERVIVQANPAPTPQEARARRGQGVALDDALPPSTLRDMRQAHAGLTDERADPSGTPVASPLRGSRHRFAYVGDTRL